jgi:tol-pal system protein YbgF
MIKKIVISKLLTFTIIFLTITHSSAQEEDTNEIIEKLKKDIKTLEKAVYSQSNESNFNTSKTLTSNDEDVLTRHLLKLSEIEQQFQELTNKFEEINFKIDRLSTRLSKVQADNQLRFQELEIGAGAKKITSTKNKKSLPGSSEPQDLGTISYKDTETKELVQKTQSVETTGTIVTETFTSEEKILPKASPKEQYNFATSLLKQGDYSTAERALREFVIENPEDKMAGNAQYWYAETFRIRQLYTDAASAYLEGYQKYPRSEKAAINLLKLGVSLVQIGEKDQGCLMIVGVKKEYPKAKQSVLQKAQYEEKKFDCKNKNS